MKKKDFAEDKLNNLFDSEPMNFDNAKLDRLIADLPEKKLSKGFGFNKKVVGALITCMAIIICVPLAINMITMGNTIQNAALDNGLNNYNNIFDSIREGADRSMSSDSQQGIESDSADNTINITKNISFVALPENDQTKYIDGICGAGELNITITYFYYGATTHCIIYIHGTMGSFYLVSESGDDESIQTFKSDISLNGIYPHNSDNLVIVNFDSANNNILYYSVGGVFQKNYTLKTGSYLTTVI